MGLTMHVLTARDADHMNAAILLPEQPVYDWADVDDVEDVNMETALEPRRFEVYEVTEDSYW